MMECNSMKELRCQSPFVIGNDKAASHLSQKSLLGIAPVLECVNRQVVKEHF